MPITKGAKKALRASKRKWAQNQKRRNALKSSIKVVHASVNEASKDLPEKLSAAYKAIDKAVKRGILKKNTAARKKSALARAVAGRAK